MFSAPSAIHNIPCAAIVALAWPIASVTCSILSDQYEHFRNSLQSYSPAGTGRTSSCLVGWTDSPMQEETNTIAYLNTSFNCFRRLVCGTHAFFVPDTQILNSKKQKLMYQKMNERWTGNLGLVPDLQSYCLPDLCRFKMGLTAPLNHLL